jgi:hypothetical protein
MTLVMSPSCSDMLDTHGGLKHLHPDLEDHPRVAAIDDGGPPMDPGRLTQPIEFHFEVSSNLPHHQVEVRADDIARPRVLRPEWT